MQARCPSCENLFTTDRLGLQFCPSCGRQVSVAGEASPPSVPVPADTPWEQREKRGWVVGYIETWKQAMFAPEPFWRAVRPDGPWLDALLYGWITTALSMVLRLPFQLLTSSLSFRNALSTRGKGLSNLPEALQRLVESADATPVISWGLLTTFGVLFIIPMMLFLGAAVLHAICLLFGEGKRGFWTTFRVVAYGSSPNLLSFIPCVGLLTAIYVMVQEVLGLKSLQGIKTEKAIGVVCLPLLLTCCCVGGIIAALGGALAGLVAR